MEKTTKHITMTISRVAPRMHGMDECPMKMEVFLLSAWYHVVNLRK